MLVMLKGNEGKDIAIDDEDVSAVGQAGEYAKVTFTEAHQSTGTGPHKGKEAFLSGITAAGAVARLNEAGPDSKASILR